ncbi:MAG TPA: tripartite tricarboxylate transporter substrate-binding protein, partial [Burkholderiales bacterium]|nr:tripartite tricarboxylate transporter substrate-binding protein [Burkholderiales bacterium]
MKPMIARLLAAALCGSPLALHAQAQAYPNKAVRIVAPFPAGGSADVIPRIIGEKLSLKWGQPVIVENRAGAAGNIGAEYVFRAEPDGYTLLSSPPPPLIINPNLYRNLPFDPTLFVPVGIMVVIPNVVLANPKVPVRSIRELIAYARANPDKLNYASQGSGTTSHLTGEMFKSMAGVRLTHIPYKGSAPALTDLLAGQVEMMFDNLGVSRQHVLSGKLKLLAVCSE